jgi:hypothetical protein
MFKKQYQKGTIAIMVICLVLIFIAISAIVASAAYMGDRMGAMSGSGMITKPGGQTTQTPPVVSGECSQSILSQAQIYEGVMYSQDPANGGHCGYPSPQGLAGVNHLDCSGLVSRVYRELGLITPSSACLTTASIPSASGLEQISQSQVQPGDIIDIPGDHTMLYVSGNLSGSFNIFACKHTGVPCGSGTYPYQADEEYFHSTGCSSSNTGNNSGG